MPYPFLRNTQIVECSAFVPASLAGLALANFGADVIRVDAIGGGIDYKRHPLVRDGGRSLFWTSLNAGKRSLAINFKRPEAKEITQELICKAGNFLTNRAVSWLAHETLAVKRADLISCVIEGHNDGSPAMECTVASETGYPLTARVKSNGPPVNSHLPAWDLVTAYQAAFAFLGASNQRMTSGEGAAIRIALSDVAFSTMAHLGVFAEAELLNQERPALGNHIYGAFGHDFQTSDGHSVMVAAITDGQWSSLVECCSMSDRVHEIQANLALDFSNQVHRYLAREELVESFSPWFMSRTHAQVIEQLVKHKVSWGNYSTPSALLKDDPRVSVANSVFEYIHTDGVGGHLSAQLAARFLGVERTEGRGAPLLGAHTDEILHDVLGLSSLQVGKLHDAGIVSGYESDPSARNY